MFILNKNGFFATRIHSNECWNSSICIWYSYSKGGIHSCSIVGTPFATAWLSSEFHLRSLISPEWISYTHNCTYDILTSQHISQAYWLWYCAAANCKHQRNRCGFKSGDLFDSPGLWRVARWQLMGKLGMGKMCIKNELQMRTVWLINGHCGYQCGLNSLGLIFIQRKLK